MRIETCLQRFKYYIYIYINKFNLLIKRPKSYYKRAKTET